MSERPTFSPFWHRVRAMTPRLRPHVEITRQRYRGRIWHVVHDPASNQFYRLNPIAYDFVCTLDGRRDVETAWKIALTKFGDAAPTQNEIIQLISQLHTSNLLSADTTPETEQLLRRGRERLGKKIKQQAIGIMYFKVRLFNPDALVTFLEPMFRPFINLWGFIVWAAFLIFTLSKVFTDSDAVARLTGGFEEAFNPANWPWLIVVFIVTKAWHELGHGVICKRFGGQVPEFGMMLLVLFPAPYVDASSAWSMPSKWRRIAVGAGGMIFELGLAAVAALIWLQQPGGLISQIAYNAMLTASISTVLFNANPLMRFDGYYILSDLLEVPNLMNRSMGMIKFLFQKHIYRVENPTPPSHAPGEVAILIIYGLAALAYRIFLFISITLFVMGKLYGIGLALAIWTAAAWFIMPVGSFIHWLSSSPQLGDKRKRAFALSALMIGAGLLLIGAVPLPDYTRADGVVESLDRSGVFVQQEGFVYEAHVRPGDRVEEGDAIITLENDALEGQRDMLGISIREVRSRQRAALRENEPMAAQALGEQLRLLEDVQRELSERAERLVVRAPHDGVVVGPDPSTMIGAYAKRGEQVCEVVDTDNVRIAAVLAQHQSDWLFGLDPDDYEVRVRPRSAVWRVYEGVNLRRPPGGRRAVPSAALSFTGGGGAEPDPQDESGQRTRRGYFTVYLDAVVLDGEAAGQEWAGTPGERVRLRFELPSKPLAEQWVRRLSQVMQGRTNL